MSKSREKADYTKYLDPKVISGITSLELKARFIVEGFLLGLHKSPYHGFSIEFSQHRPYMQGDSFKDIDWKVYGKTEKFYVKQYEEETNLKCHIVLDVSKSMAYKSEGNIAKIEYASYLAASLAWLMLKQNDSVGLILYSDSPKTYLPPKASNNYIKEILKILARLKTDNTTDIGGSLHKVAEQIKRRGLVIIISDLFDEPSSIISSLKHFRFNENETLLFHILDPLERSFAFSRDAIFVDMETEEEMTTQPRHIQKAYQGAMREYLHTMKTECLNNDIGYHLLDTSEPFDTSLYAFLQKRKEMMI